MIPDPAVKVEASELQVDPDIPRNASDVNSVEKRKEWGGENSKGGRTRDEGFGVRERRRCEVSVNTRVTKSNQEHFH